ncbi:unnamed protein product [Rotaria sp. Silwood1]|nr:unnamed protein product [Rotaria sp. Silwood1]
MLSPFSSINDNNDSNIIDSLYQLCKDNEIEKVRSILPFIGNINIINRIQTSTGSTCLHVACYYGHREMVEMLLEYGAVHSIRNIRYNLTPYEEAQTDDIKQLILEHQKLFSNNDYDYIEWSVVGDDLLGKRREFREAIDVYKTYDNHHLMSKLLAEVIHYYLNEYLVNQINDTKNPEDQITRKQIETIESYFKEAIEKQDYLTYFIKAYTLTNFFYKVLNRNLALYILEYFDETKTFSSNYRLVNCLVHIVTLLIYNPNLPQYQYQGICYRGMRITQNDLDQYQLNQHILNRTFLSTSTDHQVAAMFAGECQQSQMRYTPNDHCALQSGVQNLPVCADEVTEESTKIPNDDENTDIFEEQQQANITLLPACLTASTSTVSTMNNATLLSTTNLLHTPSVPNATSDINTSSGPTENLELVNSMQDQLTFMAQQLMKISSSIENIQLEKNNKASSSPSQQDEIEQLFENITCSDDSFNLKCLEINYQLDMIICISCCT